MGADVDSSARTSATRKFLRAGGRGLRHTISNMPTLPTPSGLATGLPHYSGQVRPAVLCVTASISGLCKARTLYSSFYVCLLDAALDKKVRPGLSHFC